MPALKLTVDSDLRVLDIARAKVMYDPSYENQLVSWTLMETWSTLPEDYASSDIRGLVNIRGLLLNCNHCSGEI